MAGEKTTEGGVNISINHGSLTTDEGNITITGRDSKTVTVGDIGADATVFLESDASTDISAPQSSDLTVMLVQWQAQMEAEIDAQPSLSADDKKGLKDTVERIHTEAAKGEQVDPGRLEKLINTLGVMGPDIFQVAIATLVNPLAGIGLVIEKVGDKAKLEQAAQAA